jgi:RimJ/RimL family protein N-acetyltransferase
VLTLSSDRLRLTPLTEDDLDEYASLRGDPRTRVYSRSGLPVPPELAREELEASSASWRDHDFGHWCVRRHDRTFVGVIHVVAVDAQPELGWTLVPAAWGQGLATEAAQLVAADLLSRAGVSQITSFLHAENVASRRIAEKLGMRLRESGRDERGRLIEAWELRP